MGNSSNSVARDKLSINDNGVLVKLDVVVRPGPGSTSAPVSTSAARGSVRK